MSAANRAQRSSDSSSPPGCNAFTRGSDIHLAPHQEHQLPHEAWHVVQQKQGRVRTHGGNDQRYIYTDRYGWIDLRHFGAAGSLAQGWGSVVTEWLGFGNEVLQWATEWGDDYRSGFSPADIPSNAAGAEFGDDYVREDEPLSTSLERGFRTPAPVRRATRSPAAAACPPPIRPPAAAPTAARRTSRAPSPRSPTTPPSTTS